MKDIYWYGITHSNEVDEYNEPRKLGFIKYWIKASGNGRISETSYKNTYNLYDYEIFSSSLEPSVIREGTYECRLVRDYNYNYYDGRGTNFTLYDGFTDKIKSNRSGQSVEAPAENISFLAQLMQQLQQFRSFKEYDLIEENKELKSRISQLEHHIQTLSNPPQVS